MPKARRNKNKGITLIKKANNLIESRYKFNQWETRIFTSILVNIKREDTDFRTYRIWYKDIIKMYGLKSGDSYRLLREAAQSLMKKSFFIAYETAEGISRETQYHILRKIDYMQDGQYGDKVENNEYIDIEFEKEMKPWLLELKKNFTTYDIKDIVKLAVYPLRVYELLKQYQSIGRRKLGVEEIKVMFEVTEQYKMFGDFFRWVIKPSVRDINKYTDITVTEVNKIKTGRKVTALEFIFHGKMNANLKEFPKGDLSPLLPIRFKGSDSDHKIPTLSLSIDLEENEKDRLFKEFHKDVVLRFGVTPTVFLQLLNTFNRGQIQQAIEVTNRAKFNQQIKSSIAGFFIHALKGGYTDEKVEAKKRKNRAEELKQYKEELKRLEEQKLKSITEKIKEVTAYNPEVTVKAIEQLTGDVEIKKRVAYKESQMKRALTVEDYRKDNILRDAVIKQIILLEEMTFRVLKRLVRKLTLRNFYNIIHFLLITYSPARFNYIFYGKYIC